MRIFVSWRGTDRDIKNRIVHQLEQAFVDEEDFKVWDSDEDCVTQFSSECILNIRNSDVFIVIVSDDAMKPSYVINEVIEARSLEMAGRLNMIVFKITNSEYTPEFAFNLNHISDANFLSRKNNDDTGIDTLVKRAKYLIKMRKMGTPEKPYSVHMPEVSATVLSKVGYFVPNSREDEFNKIDSLFTKSNVLFLTKMDGYGKRSVIKKWAELHAASFEKVFLINNFSGSLYDFFLRGLEFSNINQTRFDTTNPKKAIQEKFAVLSQLTENHLIIVPNINIGLNDNNELFEQIASLKCRFVFITTSIPKKVEDFFPPVEIGKLKNIYLRELFFHYYNNVTEEEKEMLIEPLDKFFDSIEGHTKSIELTAITIADEFGIYPEDIPGILEDIQLNSDNELSERIYALILKMFDISSFDDDEKNILYILALLSGQPVDEKYFIDTLRECKIENAKAIRKLADSKWIEYDKENRTLYIEKFVAKVCLSQIQKNEEIINTCLNKLYNEISSLYYKYSFNKATIYVNYISNLFSSLEMTSFEMLTKYTLKSVVLDEKYDFQQIKKYQILAAEDIMKITDEDMLVILDNYYSLIDNFMKAAMSCFDTSLNDNNYDFNENFNQVLLTSEILDSIYEIDNPYLFSIGNGLINALQTNNYMSFVNEFIKISNIISRDDFDEFGSQDKKFEKLLAYEDMSLESFLLLIIYRIGYAFITTIKQPKIKMQLCKSWLAINDKYKLESDEVIFQVYCELFNAAVTLQLDEAELEELYIKLMLYFTKVKKTFFKSTEERDVFETSYNDLYLDIAISRKNNYLIDKLFDSIMNIKCTNYNTLKYNATTLSKVVYYYVGIADVLKAKRLLKDHLFNLASMMHNVDSDEILSIIDIYDDLNDLASVLNSESFFNNDNSTEDYKDYYNTYSKQANSSKLAAKYAAIGQEALRIDYSHLTDNDVADLVEDLRHQAKQYPKWEYIAPSVFALVSEVGYRILGYRHHYVQYIGAAAIADGKVAEILNGEGKTYTIILAAFLQSLYGKQVHIIDSSPYLTIRNYQWMKGIFEYLGCKVALLSNNFYDNEIKLANANIVYSTVSNEITHRMRLELECNVKPNAKYDFAIFDEADETIISYGNKEHRIISNENVLDETEILYKAYQIYSNIKNNISFYYTYKNNSVVLKDTIYPRIEEEYNQAYSTIPEKTLNLLEAALKIAIMVNHHYQKNVDYFITETSIKFEDKQSGNFTEFNKRYQYFIALKEKMYHYVSKLDLTVKKIANVYNVAEFVTVFKEISGTTATAVSMQNEFAELYNLDIFCVAPNKPIKRIDNTPIIFVTKESKFNYLIDLIVEKKQTGQPIIAICGSVEDSREVSELLRNRQIEHVLLNAENSDEENEILEEAGRFNKVTITTALANRGVDIVIGGNPRTLAKHHLAKSGVSPTLINEAIYGPVTSNQEINNIRENYQLLVTMYENETNDEREKINQLGGLCVVGTECFDDLRIEQQVRGRSGRQGAHGESYIIYSLEDNKLQSIFANRIDALKNMIAGQNVGFQGRIMNNMLLRLRKKIQTATFNQIKNSDNLLYFKGARRKILGLIDDIESNRISLEELLIEYCLKIPKNASAFKKYYSETDISSIVVLKKFLEENGKTNKSFKEAFNLYCSQFLTSKPSREFILRHICIALRQAWIVYYDTMESQNEVIQRRYSNSFAKIKKYLEDLSESICNNCIVDAVTSALSAYQKIKDKMYFDASNAKNFIEITANLPKELKESNITSEFVYEHMRKVKKAIINNSIIDNTIDYELLIKEVNTVLLKADHITLEQLPNNIDDIDFYLNTLFTSKLKYTEETVGRYYEELIRAVYLKVVNDFTPEIYKCRIKYIYDYILGDITYDQYQELANAEIVKVVYTFSKTLLQFFAYSKLKKNDQPKPLRTTIPVSKNDPCPCGSGKKYKYCCGMDK